MYISAGNSAYDTQNVSGVTISGNSFQASGPDQGSLLVWAEGSTQSIKGVSASRNQFNNPADEAVELAGAGPMAGSINNNTSYQSGSFSASSAADSSITFSGSTVSSMSSYPGSVITPVGGAVPLFSLPTGTYTLPQTLTLNEPSRADTIKYCTITGSDPCTPATTYSSSIMISSSQTVCALGIDSSSLTPVTSASECSAYNGGGTPAATPTFSPTPESFVGTPPVTLSDSTTGTTIYYYTSSPAISIITTVEPTLTDGSGNVWSIASTSGGQMVINWETVSVTNNVIEIVYVNGNVWQLNTAANWYEVTYVTSPTVPTVGFGSATTTSPIPAYTTYNAPFNLSASSSVTAYSSATGKTQSTPVTATIGGNACTTSQTATMTGLAANSVFSTAWARLTRQQQTVGAQLEASV